MADRVAADEAHPECVGREILASRDVGHLTAKPQQVRVVTVLRLHAS